MKVLKKKYVLIAVILLFVNPVLFASAETPVDSGATA